MLRSVTQPNERDSTGALAVEHGRITTMDGTSIAESFQTRPTTQR